MIAQAAPNIPSTQEGNTLDSNFFRIFYGMRNGTALAENRFHCSIAKPATASVFVNIQRVTMF
ncbi:hypothetical protein [Burkholderia ubonensis]|uniref:hypothetical protein n=1 Tax=Burkholderia ubonensis TaxID=101571 RepID=UPI0012F9791C|nr:hypothetical protein [Burkholderia ubonensis]